MSRQTAQAHVLCLRALMFMALICMPSSFSRSTYLQQFYAFRHILCICRHKVISVLYVEIFLSIIMYGITILSMNSKSGNCTFYALLQAPGVVSAGGEISYVHITAPTPGKLCYKMRLTGWLLLLHM